MNPRTKNAIILNGYGHHCQWGRIELFIELFYICDSNSNWNQIENILWDLANFAIINICRSPWKCRHFLSDPFSEYRCRVIIIDEGRMSSWRLSLFHTGNFESIFFILPNLVLNKNPLFIYPQGSYLSMIIGWHFRFLPYVWFGCFLYISLS